MIGEDPARAAERARLEAMPELWRAALRRALLQRVADRLGLARLLSDELEDEDGVRRELAACCWVRYEVTRRVWDQRYDAGGRAREATSRWRTERWVHRLCAEDCPHWHHQTEVWIAMAAPPP